MNRRGQVTIFVIIALVLAGGIILYFSIDRQTQVTVPQEFRQIYDYYLSCLEEVSKEGIRLMGSQGGYIQTPAFEPGSQYAPFSSQLNFLGQGIPYWMYNSGNNLLKEQVPQKSEMEQELGTYLEERLSECDFSDFEQQGYDIYSENGTVTTQIEELQVGIDITALLTLHRGESSIVLNEHTLQIDSRLGTHYDLALQTYNHEKESMFLEKYALDVLRLYAPVTGTDISCSPRFFIDEHIRSNLTSGLASNIVSLKLAGDYYDVSSQERSYFVVDPGFTTTSHVNFLYDPSWPTRIEIEGDRVAKPVGIQEGLGILGFCYVPYHLVYDISFPVLIQFIDGEELFQFPVSVVIAKNRAREALPSLTGSSIESEICETRNQEIEIRTYNTNLEPVESNIQYRCLTETCSIGQTKSIGDEAALKTQVPQCVNGILTARAPGYAETKKQFSSNEGGIARIVMNKKFKTTLDLGSVTQAMVTFESPEYSATTLYPDSKTIELIEGAYNVTVYAYDNSSLTFPKTTKRRCVDVPESGVAGFLGVQKEQCFDIDLPETEITFAVVGGGKTSEYITEEQLENSEELNINVPLFGTPRSLEDLQRNHAAVEEERIFLDFTR